MTSWRAEQFDLLPRSVAQRWSTFGAWPEQAYFSNLVGIHVEELRRDYARMSLPWRAELNQPAGLMHGGAIATLIDTVVVPAIGTAYERPRPFSTIEGAAFRAQRGSRAQQVRQKRAMVGSFMTNSFHDEEEN